MLFLLDPMPTHHVFTGEHTNVPVWLPYSEVLVVLSERNKGVIPSAHWRLPTQAEARLVMLSSLVSAAGRASFYDYYSLDGPFWLDSQYVTELQNERRPAKSHAMLLLVRDDIL